MNDVLNRIHLGMMGDAICHATYGWFCEYEIPEPPVDIEVVFITSELKRVVDIEVEL